MQRQDISQNQANKLKVNRQAIQRCSKVMLHSSRCRGGNCRIPSCEKMKRVSQHSISCRKNNGDCSICQQYFQLCCYHAKGCSDQKCLVSFCPDIKRKLKRQHLRKKIQQLAELHEQQLSMPNKNTQAFLSVRLIFPRQREPPISQPIIDMRPLRQQLQLKTARPSFSPVTKGVKTVKKTLAEFMAPPKIKDTSVYLECLKMIKYQPGLTQPSQELLLHMLKTSPVLLAACMKQRQAQIRSQENKKKNNQD